MGQFTLVIKMRQLTQYQYKQIKTYNLFSNKPIMANFGEQVREDRARWLVCHAK